MTQDIENVVKELYVRRNYAYMTAILRDRGGDVIPLGETGVISRAELLSRQVWDAALFGELRFYDENGEVQRIIKLTQKVWAKLVEWLYERVDGKPVDRHLVAAEGQGEGGEARGEVRFVFAFEGGHQDGDGGEGNSV